LSPSKDAVRLPRSFRNVPATPAATRGGSRTTLALGVSGVLLAPLPVAAADVINLDKLRIEERAIDTNPHAEPGAPYKAKTSGDERITRPLAETPFNISVLTKTEIDDSGYTDLREILDAQPGITLGTGENGMTIRESFATDQVEISKGPNSSFAGRGTAQMQASRSLRRASERVDALAP